MITKYNRISLCLGIPGIILQLIGFVTVMNYTANSDPSEAMPFHISLMQLIWAVGTVLLLVGLAYYAIAKGQSAIWCLSAFLGIIGLLILSILKDKCPTSDDLVDETQISADSKRSRLAISSLVLSILGLFTFGLSAIFALVIGVIAVGKIKRSKGQLTGQRMAIIGIVISTVIICVFGYIIFMAATA